MRFVGLVPSERSSGHQRSRGSNTKAGNGHVRRLVVEAAWHQRQAARVCVDRQPLRAAREALPGDAIVRLPRQRSLAYGHGSGFGESASVGKSARSASTPARGEPPRRPDQPEVAHRMRDLDPPHRLKVGGVARAGRCHRRGDGSS